MTQANELSASQSPSRLLRFMLGQGEVRGQIIRLDQAWQEVAKRHPGALGLNALGELSAAAQLLAASLRFDGSLILQIHGDGPVQLMVVECWDRGAFRATIKIKEEAQALLDAQDPHLSDLVNRHGQGRFAVTLDPGKDALHRQAHQGIVPFEGSSVAQVLENYASRSEQIPTRLFLAANGDTAVGLLLQKMPGEGGKVPLAKTDQDLWPRVQVLAETLLANELLVSTPEQILQRLFWQEQLNLVEERHVRFACTCSRQKVAAMLKMLGKEEVESILHERGEVLSRCDFCNTEYRFDAVDAAGALLENVAASVRQQ